MCTHSVATGNIGKRFTTQTYVHGVGNSGAPSFIAMFMYSVHFLFGCVRYGLIYALSLLLPKERDVCCVRFEQTQEDSIIIGVENVHKLKNFSNL